MEITQSQINLFKNQSRETIIQDWHELNEIKKVLQAENAMLKNALQRMSNEVCSIDEERISVSMQDTLKSLSKGEWAKALENAETAKAFLFDLTGFIERYQNFFQTREPIHSKA